MTVPPLTIVPLGDHHDRSFFSCGRTAIDDYFKAPEDRGLARDLHRNLTKCHVWEGPNREIVGFFTLSMTSMPLDALSGTLKRKLGPYDAISAALIGRMGVHIGYQGRGCGGVLLTVAEEKAACSEFGVALMILDAKDEKLSEYYAKFGYRALNADVDGYPRRMFKVIDRK